MADRPIHYRALRWALRRAMAGLDWYMLRSSRLIGGPE